MKQALMVLDIQNDYCSDQARMTVAKHQIKPTINGINDLIKRAEKSNVPIIYIRNEFARTHVLSNLLRRFTALKGTQGAELDERLLNGKGAYFSKKKADAFSNPSLITYLEKNGINEILITGVFIEGCVTATVKGALAKNFDVTVVRDAVAGATDQSEEAALTKFATLDILIHTSQQIFESENDKGNFEMTLLQRLIEQAKKPRGFVGSLMLRIMNKAHSGMNTWLMKQEAINDGDIVLDIGCGGGKTLQSLSKINPSGKIHGIDFSAQAVKDSIKTNQMDVANGKVIVTQASVSSIPYTDQFFDTITAFQTHYFWADLANDVKEVYRVLKDDGKFIIISELYKINYHMKAYKTKSEIKQLFESVGFQTVTIRENTQKGWLCITGLK